MVRATYSFKESHVCSTEAGFLEIVSLTHSVSGGRIGICRRIGNEEWVQKGLLIIYPNWSGI